MIVGGWSFLDESLLMVDVGYWLMLVGYLLSVFCRWGLVGCCWLLVDMGGWFLMVVGGWLLGFLVVVVSWLVVSSW